MNTIFLEEYILTRYVPYHRGKCLKNISGDLQMINRIMRYEIVKKPLNEIKKNDLIIFFAELQTSRNISKSTVNRYYSRFSNIFTFALDEGDVGRNPLKGIKKFKEKYRSRCLSETEISALLRECRASKNKELYNIVVLALNTGMRRGEILALTSDNITIRGRKILLHGYMTKTGESREIPLNDTALEILSECLKQSPKGRIFKSRDFSCAFENAMKYAGIEQARFHDLRRTFATNLMDEGVLINIISRILGHSNVLTTERYLYYREKPMLESVSKIGFK